MKQTSFSRIVAAFSAAAVLSCSSQLQACPMCMGAPDAKTGEALNGAIFLMLGCIGAMLAGVGAVAIAIARRGRTPIPPGAEFTQSFNHGTQPS